MMRVVDTNEHMIVFATRANWLLLLVAGVAGNLFASPMFATGVIVGGLIMTVNFHLLARTLKKTFRDPRKASTNSVLIKYFIRFAASGAIITVLITQRLADPIGLCIGLSVVVINLTLAAAMEFRTLFTKEAV